MGEYKYKLDRTYFRLWAEEGLLMYRDKDCDAICLDLEIYEKAQEALDRGDAVVLCVDGKPFSRLRLEGNTYVERMIDGDE
jgi:hypothetical protein